MVTDRCFVFPKFPNQSSIVVFFLFECFFFYCYCDSFTCVSRFSVCVWSVAVLNKFRFVRFTQVIDQLVLNLPQTNGGFSFPLPWRLFNVSALLYDPAQTIAPSPSVFGVVFERGAHTLFTKYYDLRARVCWMKVFRLLFLQQTLLRNVNEKEKTNARVCVCVRCGKVGFVAWIIDGVIREENHIELEKKITTR